MISYVTNCPNTTGVSQPWLAFKKKDCEKTVSGKVNVITLYTLVILSNNDFQRYFTTIFCCGPVDLKPHHPTGHHQKTARLPVR